MSGKIDANLMRRFMRTLELLRSPMDGEVLSAASRATSLLGSMGFDSYSELFSALLCVREQRMASETDQHETEKEPPKTSRTRTSDDRRYSKLARMIRKHSDFEGAFNEREREFIENMATWRRSFSEKQRGWITNLAAGIGLSLDDANLGRGKERKKPSRNKAKQSTNGAYAHTKDEKWRQEHFRTI